MRKFKEKTLGPASMPKHQAQHKLADYIEEYTGRLTKQGRSIATFADLWKAFSAVKAGRWSKKTREDLKYLFGKHVLPIIGIQVLREITLTSLQLLLNKMAEDGYGETAVGRIRKCIKACFEYGIDEDLVSKNPARKLEMPTIRKKVCDRFLSLEEIGALLSEAAPREHAVLHILTACGLRPAEILVLRMEDFDGTKLRIDEALKDREKGEARIGRTKTKESDGSVPVPPDLSREIAAWIAAHPAHQSSSVSVSEPQRNAVQRRELLEAAPEAVSGEGGNTRSYSSGISAHLFQAHSELRERQGPARPPPTHQPPNDTETQR